MSDAAFRGWTEAAEVERELLASAEWKLVSRFETFGRSARLLENNAHEFWLAVHFLTKDNRSLLLDGKELKRWLEEVDRRLHNVVAAVKTVVDHTRALSSELYGPQGISPEYNERTKTLGRLPVVKFVQQLRELFQHWRLPEIVHIASSHRGRLSRTIALIRDDLLKWGGWSAPARAFIEQSGKEIEIGPVVENYTGRIREFHFWFADQFRIVHATEYANIKTKFAEIARARAPFVFERLREDVARAEGGTMSAADALSPWMDEDDQRLLEQLLAANIPSWVDSALHVLGEKYGQLPEDIVTRYRNAVRH